MKTTTFYSFKGGVGRTLLLAWSAQRLAHGGKSVVAVDLDLEAPGLAFKFGSKPDQDHGPGVVGLLASFLRGDDPPEPFRDCFFRPREDAKLWVLPAGRAVSPEYCRDLAQLRWDSLFLGPEPNGVHFFLWLKKAIESEFGADHLLVDARTGVTEIGGAALSLLADQVLAILGTSQEGVFGTRAVLRALMTSPRLTNADAPRIQLLVSRMPPASLPEQLLRHARVIRDAICEEADPLHATVSTGLPLVVRSEPSLQIDERIVFDAEELRVHHDYETVVQWIDGSDVSQQALRTEDVPVAALASLRETIDLQRRLAEVNPERYERDLAGTLGTAAFHLAGEGHFSDALDLTREAAEIHRRLSNRRVPGSRRDLCTAILRHADIQMVLRQAPEAIASLEEAIPLLQEFVESDPTQFDHQRRLSVTYGMVADQRLAIGDLDGAADAYRDAERVARHMVEAQPEHAESARNLSVILQRIGDLFSTRRKYDMALDALGKSRAILRDLLDEHPDQAGYQRDLSISVERIGEVLESLDRHEEADQAHEESLRLRGELVRDDPDSLLYQRDFAVSLVKAGDRYRIRERERDARLAYAGALEVAKRLAEAEPTRLEPQRILASSFEGLASAAVGEERVAAMEHAVAIRKRVVESYAADPVFVRELADSVAKYAELVGSSTLRTEAEVLLASLRDRDAHGEAYSSLTDKLQQYVGEPDETSEPSDD